MNKKFVYLFLKVYACFFVIFRIPVLIAGYSLNEFKFDLLALASILLVSLIIFKMEERYEK